MFFKFFFCLTLLHDDGNAYFSLSLSQASSAIPAALNENDDKMEKDTVDPAVF
jgi:hypothetical protein